jgi:hypothetical protein
MALTRALRCYVGEDKGYTFEIFDQEGMSDVAFQAYLDAGNTPRMQDVALWGFEFAVRKGDKTTGTPLILKSSGSPLEISVTGVYDVDRLLNTQRVLVMIEDTDTAAADGSAVLLAPKTYRYSLKRTDDGAETILTVGDFELLEATLR